MSWYSLNRRGYRSSAPKVAPLMVLSRRWMVMCVAWFIIAGLAWTDATTQRDYVALLDDSGLAPADALPLHRPVPADYADAQTWTRFALAIDEGGAVRLRSTDIDNAPTGRPVQWNSSLAHALALAGTLRSLSTGEALPMATERALAWINLPLFLAVVVLLSSWAARRLGTSAGVLLAFGMIGHRLFYAGFAPNYVDHHGLLSAASLATVLGAALMGAGWHVSGDNAHDAFALPPSRERARTAAVCSALAGAFGMWISAASVIPTIAFVGIAGIAAVWFPGPSAHDDGAHFDGELWRLWSRVGAGASFIAYLLEYAPAHMGVRLEVNHPLYALAWLGGGELVALIGAWRINGARIPAARITLASIALLAAPLVMAIAGARVMIPLDPRMAALHNTIAEFQSILAVARAGGTSALLPYAAILALLIPSVAAIGARPRQRLTLCFALLIAIASTVLACYQIRWWLAGSGPALCVLVIGIQLFLKDKGRATQWLVLAGICTVFAGQAISRTSLTRANVHAVAVTESDAAQPLYRDVASAIRQSQPSGDVVLLASPNASSGIGYFGRFKTLGTLYWENVEGLSASADIFSSRNDEDARVRMAARGVTHVALVGRDDYLRHYLQFAKPGSPDEEFGRTFGARLTTSDVPPPWLREIGFAGRGDQTPSLAVRIFQVVPEPSSYDALWSAATAHTASRRPARAWPLFEQAIALAPEAQRGVQYDKAARIAFPMHEHALALRLFDRAVALDHAAASIVAAAWIRATSSDESARDGGAALTAIEPLARAHPNDPALLEVLAAALAEVGRFQEAVAVAERVVALRQQLGDQHASVRDREHLDSYRAGHPWRR